MSETNLAGASTTQATTAIDKQEQATEADYRKNFNYPLVKYSDMADEVRTETVDLISSIVEKYSSNFEAGAKTIKEALDKKFGSNWHVVIGEGFAYEITHEMKNLLFMFFGGNLGILMWKAS